MTTPPPATTGKLYDRPSTMVQLHDNLGQLEDELQTLQTELEAISQETPDPLKGISHLYVGHRDGHEIFMVPGDTDDQCAGNTIYHKIGSFFTPVAIGENKFGIPTETLILLLDPNQSNAQQNNLRHLQSYSKLEKSVETAKRAVEAAMTEEYAGFEASLSPLRLSYAQQYAANYLRDYYLGKSTDGAAVFRTAPNSGLKDNLLLNLHMAFDITPEARPSSGSGFESSAEIYKIEANQLNDAGRKIVDALESWRTSISQGTGTQR